MRSHTLGIRRTQNKRNRSDGENGRQILRGHEAQVAVRRTAFREIYSDEAVRRLVTWSPPVPGSRPVCRRRASRRADAAYRIAP